MTNIKSSNKSNPILDLTDYYETINHALAINFSSLRGSKIETITRQIIPEERLNDVTKSWLDAKCLDLSDSRADFFNTYTAMNKTLKLANLHILREGKQKLLVEYNKYYGKSLQNVNTIVDGFKIIDPSLFNDFKRNNHQKLSREAKELIKPLMIALNDYLSAFDFVSRVDGYYELFDAVKNDLDVYGNPSFTYQNSPNPNIITINRKQIINLLDVCEAQSLHAQNNVQKQQKLVDELTKSLYANPENKNIENALNIHTKLLIIAKHKQKQSDQLCRQAIILSDRIVWANTSADTLLTDLESDYYDLISLIPKEARKSKLIIDTVYIHSSEIESMRQLTHPDSEVSSVLNTFVKEKQEDIFEL